MTAARRLLVNADDFGFTRDVNAGIIEAHRDGILTATTLMANGGAFDDAVRLAGENPQLDLGCHLVLVQGNSEAGILPTHLDTHKHTHLLPQVLEAVARLSEEFRIPWVRRPFDFGATNLVGRVLHMAGGSFRRVLAKHGCRTTDYFAGFQMTGKFGAPELATLIRRLPTGTTEFMCHPGRCGAELRAARTRLKESRETELRALTAPETRRALDEAGVKLVSYREL